MVRMRKSRLSQSKQDRLIEHFVAGTTARCTASLVSVSAKTSAYYYRRLRELIALELGLECNEIFGGEIEVDDKLFWWQAERSSRSRCWR